MFFQDKVPVLNLKKAEIQLILNGNSSFSLTMKLTSNIQMHEIETLVKEKWKKKFKRFRLFTAEGVELFQDDLQFLKPGRTFYVSKGEDFDQFSCFSEYDLVQKLGEGGFGKVYLGVHKSSHDKVAIKIINSGLISNAQETELVFREAEALMSLNHPNIVKILKFFTIKNMHVAILMEYLQGGELLEHLQAKGKLTEEEARNIFIQILNAISYCHKEKIIHRDLKLENILFTDQTKTTIKIVDFGIASLYLNSNIDSFNAGTLKYMAPELFHKKSSNAASCIDVWAMGCIVFALVTGNLPFNGDSRKIIRDKIINENAKFPENVEISQSFKDLIEKMLEKDPKKRIALGDIFHHSWVKHEEFWEEKSLMVNHDKEEIKSVLLKKSSYDKNNHDQSSKNKNHIKRNSATIKLMSSKENLDAFETNKPYNSLLRGCKQILLESKFNEKK